MMRSSAICQNPEIEVWKCGKPQWQNGFLHFARVESLSRHHTLKMEETIAAQSLATLPHFKTRKTANSACRGVARTDLKRERRPNSKTRSSAFCRKGKNRVLSVDVWKRIAAEGLLDFASVVKVPRSYTLKSSETVAAQRSATLRHSRSPSTPRRRYSATRRGTAA
jgi:hypothetical protein